tara:strand:- start:133 stop:1263 length:1131 start_codon:yes stop_codon:yes gene_type:complete
MKKIQMVDLKSQYNFIKNEVAENMSQVFETSTFVNGPMVDAFQADMESYLNVKHVIPCANGTDALQIALMGFKLDAGDEVITSDFTFAATAEVISLLNLKLVLVDVDPRTFNIDPKAIERVITSKTKAIVPVHLFGQCAAMDSILELAKKYDLFVLEDNAQAMGATHNFINGKEAKTGTLGNAGATSFFPSKNLGAYGDGGAIFTNDDQLAHSIRAIANHGMSKRYYHDVVGLNSRLDALQASVLKVKLQYLDFYNERRKEAAIRYTDYFKNHQNLVTPYRAGACNSHVFHQYTLRVIDSDRDALVDYLNKHEIPCGLYYPLPLHSQKAYTDPKVDSANFPVTNQLVKEVISLPMHSELTNDQIDYISSTVLEFFS